MNRRDAMEEAQPSRNQRTRVCQPQRRDGRRAAEPQRETAKTFMDSSTDGSLYLCSSACICGFYVLFVGWIRLQIAKRFRQRGGEGDQQNESKNVFGNHGQSGGS